MKKIYKRTLQMLSITILIFFIIKGTILTFENINERVHCTDPAIWDYCVENFGWDPDGDGYQAFVPEQYAESIAQKEAAYKAIYGGGSLSSSPSTTSNSSKSAASNNVSKITQCDHDYVAEVTAPATCVAEGITTYTCSKCGDTYTEAIPIDANAHEWGEPVIVESTCTEKGTKTYTCKLCGETKVEYIDALGHDYVETITKEPTCTEAGIKTFTCSKCGDTYTEDIPALGHVESDWIIDKKATTFFEGSRHKICTRCNEVLTTEVIPSKYPTWYLYALIGIGIVIIGIIIGIVIKKRKGKDDDNAIDEQKALDMLKNA